MHHKSYTGLGLDAWSKCFLPLLAEDVGINSSSIASDSNVQCAYFNLLERVLLMVFQIRFQNLSIHIAGFGHDPPGVQKRKKSLCHLVPLISSATRCNCIEESSTTHHDKHENMLMIL